MKLFIRASFLICEPADVAAVHGRRLVKGHADDLQVVVHAAARAVVGRHREAGAIDPIEFRGQKTNEEMSAAHRVRASTVIRTNSRQRRASSSRQPFVPVLSRNASRGTALAAGAFWMSGPPVSSVHFDRRTREDLLGPDLTGQAAGLPLGARTVGVTDQTFPRWLIRDAARSSKKTPGAFSSRAGERAPSAHGR
jgi:hypothetical protein